MQNTKSYRVVQNEGHISWRIEEMWEGGVQRTPFSSRQVAIAEEEKIAKEQGFYDELVLEEVGEEVVVPLSSFEKESEETWECIQGCSINVGNDEIVLNRGMRFTRGVPYLGVDVAKWLDENYKK